MRTLSVLEIQSVSGARRGGGKRDRDERVSRTPKECRDERNSRGPGRGSVRDEYNECVESTSQGRDHHWSN